jgi:hypothetical protein
VPSYRRSRPKCRGAGDAPACSGAGWPVLRLEVRAYNAISSVVVARVLKHPRLQTSEDRKKTWHLRTEHLASVAVTANLGKTPRGVVIVRLQTRCAKKSLEKEDSM